MSTHFQKNVFIFSTRWYAEKREGINMTIGERIKNRRLELGLSQDELAKKIGYASRASINKLENSRSIPLKKVEIMARALEISPGKLMGWEDEEGKEPKKVSQNGQSYYFSDETAEAAQELFENPNLRVLFDAARDAKPEDLKMAADMLKRFKETNPDG
jgi:transcriptional regulator with XRE-family HTH domain